MSMVKNIPHAAWDYGAPALELVKIASTGLGGHDLAALVKRAGHPLAKWARDNRPLPGEVWVHNIACGSTERVGINRNADGYTAKMLERDHPTFKKSARWFYNHQNNDLANSYGIVKESWYNPELQRAEVIVALNGNKEAAERTGGKIAERTLQKMASGIDVAVSQSCRVPYDVCLSCGNKAKTRAQYCTPDMCKYGGCRDNLGRVFDDGFHLGVDNPHCHFFDLSDVSDTRGADRTAFLTGKIAAAQRVVGGAELAEQLGLVAPDRVFDDKTLAAKRCLQKLAAHRVCSRDIPVPDWADCLAIRAKAAGSRVSTLPARAARDYQAHALVGALAADGVVLPPAEWLSCVSGVSLDKAAMVFSRPIDPALVLSRPDACTILADAALSEPDNRLSPGAYAWAAPTALALEKEARLAVLAPRIKIANTRDVPPAVRTEAATRYLAYQGNFLANRENSANFGLLLSECCRHTRGR